VDGADTDAQNDDRIFEYACHEANYGMTNLLPAPA
jgi:hypothetical protein